MRPSRALPFGHEYMAYGARLNENGKFRVPHYESRLIRYSCAMGMILLGYRGSGKTTIGRQLTQRLNLPFVDTDDLITAMAGKTIREIFERDGEPRFRELEAAALREVCRQVDSVVSIGGGAILRDENRVLLRAALHKRVYLRCEPVELVKRIHADPRTAANRPSLTHLGGGIEEVRSLLALREPLYREVMTDELDVSQLSIDQAVTALAPMIE